MTSKVSFWPQAARRNALGARWIDLLRVCGLLQYALAVSPMPICVQAAVPYMLITSSPALLLSLLSETRKFGKMSQLHVRARAESSTHRSSLRRRARRPVARRRRARVDNTALTP